MKIKPIFLLLMLSIGGCSDSSKQIDGEGSTAKDPTHGGAEITVNDQTSDSRSDFGTHEPPKTDDDDSDQELDSTDKDEIEEQYPRVESDLEPEIPNYGPTELSCTSNRSCSLTGASCGYINDGCNGVLDCGGCQHGKACIDNNCVDPCSNTACPADQYCQNNYYGALCRCQPGFYWQNSHCVKQKHATITLMAANITSGPQQTYTGPGLRIFKALKPDIVMIQEFDYDSYYDKDYGYTGMNEMVYRAFGPEYTFHVGKGAIPNGIVSRYPIMESGNWDDGNGDRDFEWAVIDIPGDRDLLAVSLHIKAGKSSSDKSDRNKQINKLLSAIKAKEESDQADYFVAIGGDFNLAARTEYAFSLLADKFVTTEPYPADQNGNNFSNTNRDHPYDGVFVTGDLDKLEIPVTIGKSIYNDGLLFDSRVYTPLSEVAPVLVTDCEPYDEEGDATNMQHMAVMKKYQLW